MKPNVPPLPAAVRDPAPLAHDPATCWWRQHGIGISPQLGVRISTCPRCGGNNESTDTEVTCTYCGKIYDAFTPEEMRAQRKP